MKDTKFILQLTFLIVVNMILLFVLNFVPFKQKPTFYDNQNDSEKFVSKLKELDKKLQFAEPVKKIKPTKVVIVKEVVKERVVKVPKIVYVEKKQQSNKKKKTILITSQKVAKKADVSKKEQSSLYAKLEKKFNKTFDYITALKLSHLYYINKEYDKALKWTEIANEINKRDDRSWIMFAKIKIEQGDIEVAKDALKEYLNSYYSKKVIKFLKGLSS